MKLRKIVTIFSLSLFLTACANNNPAPNDVSNIQTEAPTSNGSSSESNNNSSGTEQSTDACAITIGNVSFSIHESKQDILAKLDEIGLNYNEAKPDNLGETRYDSYYHIDAWMQIYFSNNECVRIRVIDIGSEDPNELAHTTKGIHPGSTYSQMVELYGDSFETHSYDDRGIYTIYRYSVNDCIYEFGIQGEDSDSIYNVDLYIPSQSPIYEYGEEIQKAN